jgi:4-hydroxyacetophenone monooxygenase
MSAPSPIKAPTNEALAAALLEAHPPALVLSLVHLTGDESLLKPEWLATYDRFDPESIGISEEELGKIAVKATEVLTDYFAGKLTPKKLPISTIRKMINFIAGAGVEVPEHYGAFLVDELALEGKTSKDPQWDHLKGAAAALPVVVIGAGMSGVLTGVRLAQAGVPFTIIEKNADVGGTWFENTYPGCRVDSSNHVYSYSFEPNHIWPSHFSTQPVLLDYFRGVAERHKVRDRVRFNTEAQSATWDDARGIWQVTVRQANGQVETLEARAVVSAVGQLNRPRFPEIKGVGTFKGPAFHSAQWRHDVDLTGKRVAVIGTGASAYQFVPEIVGKVKTLTVFQRTPPWGFPTKNYHDAVPAGMNWLLEHVPFYEKWYRFFLFWMMTDGFLEGVRIDPQWQGDPQAISQANAELREKVRAGMIEFIGDRTDLLDKVLPNYPIGSKRSLLDNGVWVSALARPNAELVTTKIAEINAKGIKTEDGRQIDVDVIIYGTGFQASKFLMPMKVTGRDGIDLHAKWAGEPRAYLGMTVPGFPNFFMLYGPNTNIVVNGSIVFFSECSVRYILGALQLLAETGAKSLDVRQDVHDAFNAKVDEGNRAMAWGAQGVSSWYKNESGRVTQNWPFALVDYWTATLAPNPKDFVIEGAKSK